MLGRLRLPKSQAQDGRRVYDDEARIRINIIGPGYAGAEFSAMTDADVIRDRWLKIVSEEFVPMTDQPSQSIFPPSDSSPRQLARAAEYSAAQLGQINRKLDRLIAIAERFAAGL
jgi:hypothetical protein